MGVLIAGALQGQVAEGRTDTIPFIVSDAKDLLVEAVLNGRDTLLLMFHSGVEGLALTEEARSKATSFRPMGSMEVGSWGGVAQVEVAHDQSLAIGRRSWTGLDLHLSRHSAVGSDGKFGPDLFAGQVVEVDFDRHVMVVHQHMPTDTTYVPLQLMRNGSGLMVPCSLRIGEDAFEQPVMLHTGYRGAFDPRHAGHERTCAGGSAGHLGPGAVEGCPGQ